jgi:GNAT superfamily N-acetyltransferase
VSVRRARAGDGEAIAAAYAELGHVVSAADVELRLAALAGERRSAALVATHGGRVVGLLTLYMVPVLHEAGDWCRVTALVVDPDARRQGVGRELVSAAEAVAHAAGCSRIEVTSARHRADAHEFYRGRGYGQGSEHFLKRMAAHGG